MGTKRLAALTYIKLLGGFALRIGDAEPVLLSSKAQALVAFLVLQEGRPVRRDIVSEMLWPDRGEQQVRNSMKQELYVLRRDGFRGADVIATTDGALSIPADRIASDVHELRGLLRQGDNAPWREISRAYDGPLLPGFAPVSAEFDDFLNGIRRALEADVLGALANLADSARYGRSDEHIAISERMLGIDPLREDTHRRLIQCYADTGRRADAMRVYADAKTLLRRDLDVAPAPETEALARRIRDCRQSVPASLPPAMTAAAAPAGHDGPPRIAVLPMRQFLDKPLANHISSGITADVVSQLAGLRELTVISHGSTSSLRDPDLDPHEIGRRLDARYLVVFSLRAAGDRFRLTTELTETATGSVLPPINDHVDAALSFEDQDRIVARLVNRLAPQVRETELRRIRGKRPDVLSVYEKVLLSREYIALLNRDHFDEAKSLLDEVIEEDPGYGEAYALAADWHSAMIGERWSTDRAGAVAAIEQLTRTALHHDSRNVRALVSYGHRRSNSYRDQDGAKRLFRQALDLSPSSAIAWALSGLCFAYSGDSVEAVRQATRALELSPYDREAYKFYHALCVAYYTSGDYEQAAEWGKRALTEKSLWRGTRGFTAASLAALGRVREAREITALMSELAPGRRVNAVVSDLQYQDPNRRRHYGELLVAAGYPV
jgi:DNA-binding SARP family transcriptional activator/TolB-like protein/Tfp pilus assembly protein PilF